MTDLNPSVIMEYDEKKHKIDYIVGKKRHYTTNGKHNGAIKEIPVV